MFVSRDVTMQPQTFENQYKYVTIKVGWDVKLIAIQLSLYGSIFWGELTVFSEV